MKGRVRTIDLGLANDRYFICMAGIGFDALVIKEADKKWKRLLGPLGYLLVAIKIALIYSFTPIEFYLDGQFIRRSGFFMIVGNTKYYGGDFMAMPKADCQDGLLDVCLFKRKGLLRIIKDLFFLHYKRMPSNLDVDYFQCREISIAEKGAHAVHVDAEYLSDTPVNIKVVPRALKVLA